MLKFYINSSVAFDDIVIGNLSKIKVPVKRFSFVLILDE
jgi:hypothetical protein